MKILIIHFLLWYLVMPFSNTLTLQSLPGTRLDLTPDHFNKKSLEKALVYYTNQTRKKHNKPSCTLHQKLHNAARAHSREMANFQKLSHKSPKKKNRLLEDRLTNANVNLKPNPGHTIIMGENLGVNYFLKISNVPYYTKKNGNKNLYINAKTGETIPFHTYKSFAKKMVQNWMDSQGHRKNMMNSKFDRIAIGVAAGYYNGFKAVYVTQLFYAEHKIPIEQ